MGEERLDASLMQNLDTLAFFQLWHFLESSFALGDVWPQGNWPDRTLHASHVRLKYQHLQAKLAWTCLGQQRLSHKRRQPGEGL